MALFDTIRAGASGAATDYLIERSLRFNQADSAHLSRTLSSEGNKRLWTWSGWLKMGKKPSGQRFIFSQRTSSSNQCNIQYSTDGKFRFESGGGKGNAFTTGLFRDPHAWYHLIVTLDSDNSTAADRIIIYVNGVRQDLDISPTISTGDHGINNNNEQVIGREADTNSLEFDGYMAEIHFIDGARKQPSDFAETDSTTGEYKPIKYTGTYGSQGWYYNFSDNSNNTASTLGKDYSGNGNNTTPGNISVSSGHGNDSVEDTPTNNWCTLTPLLGRTRSDSTFTEGNLKVQTGSGANNVGSSFAVASGKWYAEFKCTAKSSVHFMIGVASVYGFDGQRQTNESQYGGFGLGYLGGDSSPAGNKMTDGGGSSSYGASYNTGDIIGVKLDMDNNTVDFAKNNSYQGSLSISTTKGDTQNNFFVFAMGGGQGGTNQTFEANFGQSGFTYTPPTGFLALNSNNLAKSTIQKGKKYMETKNYTGNGGTLSVTGLDFSPDWVWCKKRNGTTNHLVFDIVRGINRSMNSNGAGSEDTSSTNKLTSFNSDGFTMGGNSSMNQSGGSYVSWNWDAGSSTVTNNNGSISSQVRALPEAGFSIVTYSGNGSAGATVGHGLGVAPASIIIKCRSNNDNWMVYHQQMNNGSSPEDFYMELNESDAKKDDPRMMNDTAPTSTVFSLKNDGSTNSSGRTYVAYCFAEIAGYSKFGMYKGTGGNDDNACVFCGFRPHWILLKKTTGGETWCLIDTARDVNNVGGAKLAPNNSNSESTVTGGDRCDIYSSGFKPRDGAGQFGENNADYVYWAFAENPFKIARAR
tara:strand:- start:767 stop:3181 length:2415 start_codon:yes stop_codon:yes gene_type:complete